MNYPMMIKLEGQEITVIGGGKIAYRKVKNFLDFGCRVRVIAINFIDEFENVGDKVEKINDKYKEEYIKDSFVVVAATDDKAINESIGNYCSNRGKLVNVVDNPHLSTYIVPSVVKRGDLIIGVSTSGKSPSLAAKIKKDLEEKYDESYEEYLNILGTLREKIIKKYTDSKVKKEKLNRLIELDLNELKKYKV